MSSGTSSPNSTSSNSSRLASIFTIAPAGILSLITARLIDMAAEITTSSSSSSLPSAEMTPLLPENATSTPSQPATPKPKPASAPKPNPKSKPKAFSQPGTDLESQRGGRQRVTFSLASAAGRRRVEMEERRLRKIRRYVWANVCVGLMAFFVAVGVVVLCFAFGVLKARRSGEVCAEWTEEDGCLW